MGIFNLPRELEADQEPDYSLDPPEVEKSGEGMTEDELLQLVREEIDRADSFSLGVIGKERSTAYDYYYGRKYGNEEVGRSQVVSRDVMEQIDAALPALVKMFTGSDKAVEFIARKAEDVPASEQATELCNYIFYTQNNGFLLVHDAFKNALLQKIGAFKWYWDEKTDVSEEIYEGLGEEQLLMLAQDPQVEIVELTPLGQDGGAFDVKVRKKKSQGRVKICVVPPDELLVAENCYGLDADDLPAVTHRSEKTVSELVEMGYDRELVMGLADQEPNTQESVSRKDRTGDWQRKDDLRKTVWYCETYIKVDFDGDGIAERRKVCTVGQTMLHNETVPCVPMSFGTPKIMPGEFFGISMADDTMDMQLLKSTVLRMTMDSAYLSVAPRVAVDTTTVENLDDVMTVRPGGIIRAKGNAAQSVVPIVVPFLGQQTFPIMEYLDAEIETRTGVSRLMQGVDPNALNKTATGVNTLMNAAQERLALVGRGFAETLVKPMFRGIMGLLAMHQHEPLTLRLRNEYVPVDPRTWATDYDMTVNVGLGVGTKDQQLFHLQALEQAQAGIAQSPFGRLVDEQKIYNLQAKKAELAGFKNPEQFYNDPKMLPPPQPPPPPPEIQKAQMQIAADKEKAQAEMQMDGQKMQMEQQNKKEEMLMDFMLEKMKMVLELQLKEQEIRLDAMVRERIAAMHPPQFDGRPQ